MMDQGEASLKLKELELNALLEITQSINNNLSESSLYKIYHFTLLGNFDVKQLALYVFDDDWQCKVNFGTDADFKKIGLPEKFQHSFVKAREISNLEGEFSEFGQVFPVLHKSKLLAVVFLGRQSTNTTFIEALTNIIIVAIENKKMARRELERESFRKEMEIARQVQHHLFPKNLPQTEKLTIAATYHPNNEVGGDYYDYIRISDSKFMVCIADVSGKGVPAALIMSNFQASLRTLLRKTDDLTEIVDVLNHQVRINGNAEIFITFFGAIYDTELHQLRYVNCGHNPTVMYRMPTGNVELLELGTTVLGMFEPLPFLNLGSVENLSSFYLFHYTDGITETLNELDEEFGIDRFIDLVKNVPKSDLKLFNEMVVSALDTFRGKIPFKDDLTLLSCFINH